MAEFVLAAQSPFAGLLRPAGDATPAGVTVRERFDLSLATVVAGRSGAAAAAAVIRQRYGVDLPSGPGLTGGGETAFIGTGPGTWLAMREGAASAMAQDLASALGGEAAVTDQTDGFAVLRLSGPRVRDTFAKGVHLDLHETAFPAGAVAVTDCAHIGVTLWRLPDEAGVPVFEVAMFRSMAGSFWDWLASSAAEFGLAVS